METAVEVVVEAPTPELTTAATDELRRALQADKTHFCEATAAGGSEFFASHGLLFEPTADVEKQLAPLSRGVDLISDLAGDESLRGLVAGLEDVLIGLDVPETGNLTLTLTGTTPGFRGVLSLEEGTCKGTPAGASLCAVAPPSGKAALALAVTKGDHLFVFVDTAKGHGGAFDLVVTLAPTR